MFNGIVSNFNTQICDVDELYSFTVFFKYMSRIGYNFRTSHIQHIQPVNKKFNQKLITYMHFNIVQH